MPEYDDIIKREDGPEDFGHEEPEELTTGCDDKPNNRPCFRNILTQSGLEEYERGVDIHFCSSVYQCPHCAMMCLRHELEPE